MVLAVLRHDDIQWVSYKRQHNITANIKHTMVTNKSTDIVFRLHIHVWKFEKNEVRSFPCDGISET